MFESDLFVQSHIELWGILTKKKNILQDCYKSFSKLCSSFVFCTKCAVPWGKHVDCEEVLYTIPVEECPWIKTRKVNDFTDYLPQKHLNSTQGKQGRSDRGGRFWKRREIFVTVWLRGRGSPSQSSVVWSPWWSSWRRSPAEVSAWAPSDWGSGKVLLPVRS